MAFGAYDKKVTWKDAGRVWLISYIGNFIGCVLLSLIFVAEPQGQRNILQG